MKGTSVSRRLTMTVSNDGPTLDATRITPDETLYPLNLRRWRARARQLDRCRDESPLCWRHKLHSVISFRQLMTMVDCSVELRLWYLRSG